MKSPINVVDELNGMLAEEVEAAVRYLYLKVTMESDNGDVITHLQEAFEETIEHAELLAAMIRDLTGVPRLSVRVDCEQPPATPDDAVHDVLTIEEAALEGYRELLEFAERDGAEAKVLEFLRKQVELESEHVNEFRSLEKR